MKTYEKVSNYITNNKLKTETIAKKAGISTKVLDSMMNGKKTLDDKSFRAICYAINEEPSKFM